MGRAGTPPEKLEVTAAVTFDRADAGFKITSSALTVRTIHGRVPGIGAKTFREAATAAKEGCPVSQALKGNVDVRLEATLES